MPTPIPSAFPEAEIQRLVRIYRETVEKLARDFVRVADWEKPEIYNLVRQNLRMLEQLDKRTKRWARRTIPGLYKATQRETDRMLRGIGLKRDDAMRSRAFTVVNHQAVQALLSDPTAGIIPTFGRAIEEVKARMRTIQTQAKLFRDRQRLIDEAIAKVGFLEGRGIEDIRNEISRAILSGSKEGLEFRKKIQHYPPGHPLRALADVPYVTFQTRTGGTRSIRLDVYADLVARTKTAQAMGLAQRNKLLENGRALVQVSNNLPLQDDACAIYIGKVYALTQQAAKEYGVPHVDRLPSGGCPFHPNCTHDETPFFPEYEPEDEKRRAYLPTPKWALDKTWPIVQKEYEKRGGMKYVAQKINPQLFRAQDSGGRRRRGTPTPELGDPWEPGKGGRGGGGRLPPDVTPPPKPGPRPISPRPPGGGGAAPTPAPILIPGGAKPTVDMPAGAAVEVVIKPPSEPAWLKETREALQKGIKDEAAAVGVGKSILDHVRKVTGRLEKIVDGLTEKANQATLDFQQFYDKRQKGEAFERSAYDVSAKKLNRTLRIEEYGRNRLKRLFRDAVTKALRRIRNVGGTIAYKAAGGLSDEAKRAIEGIQKVLPRSWIERMNRHARDLRFVEEKIAVRGDYSLSSRRIRFTSPTAPGSRGASTIVHEIGHDLESVHPDLRARVEEFYARRTAGANAVNIPPYPADELFKAGGWKEPYIGKWYGGGKASEVLSMSLEAIYGEDPAALVHLQDPDLMRFILGLLAGVP